MRGWRRLHLAAHLVRGVLTLALVYPLAGPQRRLALRQRWSARLLEVLAIRLEVFGEAVQPGSMLVANHVSWIDIFAINALAPAAFISKAEVRAWPVIGWLAAKNETVFLRRGSRGHARIVNAEIAALLDEGRNVAVFPEGTTTDGSHVLHFHGALLQPAVEAGRPLQALALAYFTADGERTRAPAYDGELSLGECLDNILAHRRLVVRITVEVPRPTANGGHRRELARELRDSIMGHIGVEPDCDGAQAGPSEDESEKGAAAPSPIAA